MNISSLKFEWSTTPGDAGIIKWKNRISPRDKLIGTLNYGDRSYQVITPKTDITTLTVHAKIVGYLTDVLKAQKVKPEHPPFLTEDELTADLPVLATTIGLYLVDDTVVTPNEITLYNHPGNKVVLPIKQGSGYYKLILSSSFVADVKYLSNTKEVQIKPVADGDLRIQLIDLCLQSKPAIITVQVLSVHIIRVEMTDKVEINKCIPAIVRLYDESDNLLNLPNLDLINLRVDTEKQIVNAKRLQPSEDEKWGDGEVRYVFTGNFIKIRSVCFN